MAEDTLKGLNVAILVTDGFEQVELTEPRKALDEAGATTTIVSPKHQRVRAWNFTDWGIELPVDLDLDRAKPSRFRRATAAGRRHQPGLASHGAKCGCLREGVLRCRKAGCRDLPWSVDHNRDRRGARPTHDLTGPRSRLTSRTPARIGWTRMRSWTRGWLRAAVPTISRRSTGKRSSCSAARVANVMPHSATHNAQASVPKQPFGPLHREVSVIGQGTWYIEEATPPPRSLPCGEASISE